MLIQLAISRSREYDADAIAAGACGKKRVIGASDNCLDAVVVCYAHSVFSERRG